MHIAVPPPQRTLIAAVSVSFFFMIGICAISVGLLLPPLMAEFGWNSATTSGLITAYSLAAMLTGPAIGYLIDRFGPRIVMLWGVAAVGAGYLGMSLCHGLLQFYIAFVVIGTGYGGAFFLGATAIVATRTGEQKNLAMGIMMAVGAVGAAISAFGINWVISGYGWRVMVQVAGLLVLAMLPIIHFGIPRQPAQEQALAAKPGSAKLPLKLAIAPYFLAITAASGLAAFGMSGINYHIVPILTHGGLTAAMASSVYGASWLISGAGSLFGGMVADRLGTRNVLAGALVLSAVGTMALGFTGSGVAGMIAAGLFVLCWGGTANAVSQYLPILIVNRYGAAHLGSLIGLQSVLMGVTGAFAPVVTGALFDRYASYEVAIVACSIPPLIAFLFVILFARGSGGATDGAKAH